MSGDDDSTPGTNDATFTRAQVRSMIAAEVRKEKEKYADYDDLKKAATEAEGQKSKLDQVLEKLTLSEKRAADAEAANLRRDVADELGLNPRQARKLTGATRDELLADGREMIEDFGIKPGSKGSEDGTPEQPGVAGTETDEIIEPPRPEPRRMGRPRENLRSGAPHTETPPDETDPMKLAALIPRR